MSIYKFLQSHNSAFLNIFFEICDFFTKPMFFLLFFALFFLFISKKYSFRLLISYMLSFFIGDIALKNLFYTPRPYDVDSSLFAIRGLLPPSSFPSTSMMLSSTSRTFLFLANHKRQSVNNLSNFSSKKNKSKIILNSILVAFLMLLFLLSVSCSKIYHAQNSVIDIICGVTLGIIIGVICFRFIRLDSGALSLLLLIFPIIVLLLNINEWLIVSYNIRAFEYSGIFASLILGMYLEKKFIGYKLSDNLLTRLLKILAFIIFFMAFYFISTLLPALSIVHFALFFVYGLVVTLLLPLLFMIISRYALVFSAGVDRNKVIFSAISLSPMHTARISKKLTRYIKMGDIVILSGDLGAGKSEIVRDFLKYCDVKDKITSPTFTLVNVYDNKQCHFYHFDMYRLEDEEEARNIGIEEMLGDERGVKFIEWAERVPHFIPSHYKKITIVKLSNKTRNIVLEDY